jgi:hypothetical protein
MTGWQKCEMRDGVPVFASSQALLRAVKEHGVSMSEAIPPGFGVFHIYDVQENSVTWYFSPEAAVLAPQFGGKPCDKPACVKGLVLLAGSQASTMLYFPDYFAKRR